MLHIFLLSKIGKWYRYLGKYVVGNTDQKKRCQSSITNAQ